MTDQTQAAVPGAKVSLSSAGGLKKEDSDPVIHRMNFTARNHFNAEISYTATCTLASSGDFLGNIQLR